MSSSPARRRRLLVARTFRQATCLWCGASLARVEFPAIHLERCERLALAETAGGVALETPEPAPASLFGRLLGRLGIATRGAVE